MTLSSKPPRREPKVDLSGLSDHQVLVRQGVVTLGELAFGPRWQSDLAAALSEEAGRRVGQAQVSHWFLGVRPIPEAMIEPLQRLAVRVADDLVRRADRIRADWVAAPQEDLDALPGPRD